MNLYKIIYPLLCALAFVTIISFAVSQPEHDKAIKAKVKELEKAGWKVVGNGNLEKLVYSYEEKKSNEGKKADELYSAYIGIGKNCNSIDSGKVAAREDAPKLVVNILANDMRAACDQSLLSDPELDIFYDNFESVCSRKIAERLVPSFYLYKQLDKENYLVTGYFLLNAVQTLELYRDAIKEAEEMSGIKFKYKTGYTPGSNRKY